MAVIIYEYGIIFAIFPLMFAFSWCVGMVILPFSLAKQRRLPTIWDTLPFAERCKQGKAKAFATILVLLYLLFASKDYSLIEFFDAILFGEEHWLVSVVTIILLYNWFGCLIYDETANYNGGSK